MQPRRNEAPRTYHTPSTFLLGTSCGHFIVLVLMSFALIAFSSLAWTYVGDCSGERLLRGDEQYYACAIEAGLPATRDPPTCEDWEPKINPTSGVETPKDCMAVGAGDLLANSRDWYESTFFAYGLFADPGTQTALSPKAGWWPKLVVIIFSLFGFIFNLVVLGLVATPV
jgi:hypothetical protein|eukprot:Transcript_540.p4 GENE.Transcript_540~~Transcript_540.p4  ORF type:complete len:170 (+),score=44.46 Transcript_540:102-611(+)